MDNRRIPLAARIYLRTTKWLTRLHTVSLAIHNGIALALLDRRSLAAVDQVYYHSQKAYRTEEYNERGLFEWENDVRERYFAGCRSILVPSTGGGREVLALRNMGYDVIGFECNDELRDFANRLLPKHGHSATIIPAERDEVPPNLRPVDGIIIGWAAYMLIRGRTRRVAFLRCLRGLVVPGAPILISFFSRREGARRFRLTAMVGNAVAGMLRRERVEPGDDLVPNYAYHFTENELSSEMADAGFQMIEYFPRPYPHAVGRAVDS